MARTEQIVIQAVGRGFRSVRRDMAGLAAGMAAVTFATTKAAKALAHSTDAYITLKNQTKVYATSQENANFKMQETIRIARKYHSGLNEVGQVLQRISLAQSSVGFSDTTAIQMVENLAAATKLSGATSQEAEGALRQFGQGLAANRLSGQELNSVLEQIPLVAQLIAQEMKVTTGELRQLGKEGAITSEVLINALGKELPRLDEMMKKFTFSIEAMTGSLGREASLAIGKFMESSGILRDFQGLLADNLITPVMNLVDLLTKGGPEAATAIDLMRFALGALVGVSILGGLGLLVSGITLLMATIGPIGVSLAAASAALGGLSLVAAQAKDPIIELAAANEDLRVSQIRLEQTSDPVRAGQLVNHIIEQREEVERLTKANTDLMVASQKRIATEIRGENLYAEFQSGGISGVDAVRQMEALLGVPSIEAPKRPSADGEMLADLIEAYDPLTDAVNKYRQAMQDLEEFRGRIDNEQFLTMQQNIATEFIKQAESTDEATAAMERLHLQHDALTGLVSAYDPLTDAVNTYSEAMQELESFRGQLDHDQFLTIQQNIANEFLRQAQNTDLVTAAMERYRSEREALTEMLGGFETDPAFGIPSEEEIERLQRAQQVSLGFLSSTELLEQFKQGFGDAFTTLKEQITNVSGLIQNGLVNSFDLVVNSLTELATTGKASFKSFARSFLQLIQKMIIQLLIAVALQSALGAFGGGTNTTTQGTGIFSGIPISTTPRRASGGPVAGGEPVLVGERGPEWFVPPQSGSIKNATESARLAQQPDVNIQVVNVDDPKSLLDTLDTEEGERRIINAIQRNPDSLRSII